MKKLLLVSGIAILILSGCTSPLSRKFLATSTVPVNSIASEPIADTESTSTDSSQIVGWQTYQNDQLGFKFQYPKEWTANVLTDAKWFHLRLASVDGKTQLDLHLDYDRSVFSFPNSEYYFYVLDFTKDGKLEISAQSKNYIKGETAKSVARTTTSLAKKMDVMMVYNYLQTETAVYNSETMEKIISTFQLLK